MDRLAVFRVGLLALGVLVPSAVFAHGVAAASSPGVEQGLLAGLVVAIALGALLYAKGLIALWRKAGVGRGIRRSQSVNFALGWAALAASLLSPVDAWAERSFAVHMVQHELLMVVAAPLIVLGRPVEAWTWALSSRVRRYFVAAARTTIVAALGYVATSSVGAWVLHALALWLWHLPMLFRAALANPVVHVAQHACFFGSALAYWWTVTAGRGRSPTGTSVASLFTTMLHTSALGALLTFAPSPWYGTGPRAFGLSPLEDQQLGGLIMWVPGGMAYMVVGLMIVGQWLKPARILSVATPFPRRPHL